MLNISENFKWFSPDELPVSGKSIVILAKDICKKHPESKVMHYTGGSLYTYINFGYSVKIIAWAYLPENPAPQIGVTVMVLVAENILVDEKGEKSLPYNVADYRLDSDIYRGDGKWDKNDHAKIHSWKYCYD